MSKFLFMLLCGALLAVSTGSPTTLGKTGKIVGGEDVDQGELPYQIALLVPNDRSYCGGALAIINRVQIVITAGHCLDYYQPEEFTLVAGDLRLDDTTGIEQRRSVAKAVVHERYDDMKSMNDIAIFFPSEPFDLNENVRPILLPLQYQVTNGQVIISGWGYGTNYTDVDILQKVEIPTVTKEVCQEIYPFSQILDTHICAGEVGKGNCMGDAGAPMKAVIGDYLAGVVSFGIGCAEELHPVGVYTQVSHFVDWMYEKVEEFAKH